MIQFLKEVPATKVGMAVKGERAPAHLSEWEAMLEPIFKAVFFGKAVFAVGARPEQMEEGMVQAKLVIMGLSGYGNEAPMSNGFVTCHIFKTFDSKAGIMAGPVTDSEAFAGEARLAEKSSES